MLRLRRACSLLGLVAACAAPDALRAQDVEVLRRFAAASARQGVAVSDDSFYAIDSRVIERFDATSGSLRARYDAGSDRSVAHLNSGVVVDGVLLCAHSNYPELPMRSSIERFDARTLAHLGSQPLTDAPGSATWVDRRGGRWWVAFAHYAGRGGEPGKGPEATSLLALDDGWRRVAQYRYPPELVTRFAGRSNSGGAFGPDGRLYLTGHDAPELYVACLDAAAGTLRWLATWPVPFAGQGIAWQPGRVLLWGISRSAREVIEVRPRAGALGADFSGEKLCPAGKPANP